MKRLVTFALLGLFSQAYAQQSTSVSSIRVTGSAVVSANPDRARIDVGVVSAAAAVSLEPAAFDSKCAAGNKFAACVGRSGSLNESAEKAFLARQEADWHALLGLYERLSAAAG